MIPQNAGAPSHELIFETLIAYQRSAALRAVIELNLFRAIGEGPGDIASLARQCGASQRGIRILCDYLTILGLLAKEDGRYRHHAQQRGIPGPPRRPASPRQRGFWAIQPLPNRSSAWRMSSAAATPYCRRRFGGAGEAHLALGGAENGARRGKCTSEDTKKRRLGVY